MFPNRTNRPKRPRPRPASGNPLYPNGTYTTPSTALYGQQGATYATLPQVNVGQTAPFGNVGAYVGGFTNPIKGRGSSAPGGTAPFANLSAGWNTLFNNPNAAGF